MFYVKTNKFQVNKFIQVRDRRMKCTAQEWQGNREENNAMFLLKRD